LRNVESLLARRHGSLEQFTLVSPAIDEAVHALASRVDPAVHLLGYLVVVPLIEFAEQ